MATVVEDRVLARIALEAVGWGADDPASLADIALGQAAVALRVLGIAAIIADPELLARARATARRVAKEPPPARLAA